MTKESIIKHLQVCKLSRIMAQISLSSAIVIIFFVAVAAEAEVRTSNYYGAYRYVVTAYPERGSISWQGDCFRKTDCEVTIGPSTAVFPPTPGVVVIMHITGHYPKSWSCNDHYEFKVAGNTVKEDTIYLAEMEHKIEFGLNDTGLHAKARENGVEIYMWSYSREAVEKPSEDNAIYSSYSREPTMGYHANLEKEKSSA